MTSPLVVLSSFIAMEAWSKKDKESSTVLRKNLV